MIPLFDFTSQRSALLGFASILIASEVNAASSSRTDHRQLIDLASPGRRSVEQVALVKEFSFPTGFEFEGTEVGGISGITYNPSAGIFYAVSDAGDNPRFYTLSIDTSGETTDEGSVHFISVTNLVDSAGEPFPAGTVTSDCIEYNGDSDTLFICVDTGIWEFEMDGMQTDSSFTLPDHFNRNEEEGIGIRDGYGLSCLVMAASGVHVWAATEAALVQDGSASSLNSTSNVRLLYLDTATKTPVFESVYVVEAIPKDPIPGDGFSDNGLVELVPIDGYGSLLALERSFAVGVGNTVRLSQIRTHNSIDTIGFPTMVDEEEWGQLEPDPGSIQDIILDIEEDLGVVPDNLEAMTLVSGEDPETAYLILISDNNFNEEQKTQFVILKLQFEVLGEALPVAQTPRVVNDQEAAQEMGVLAGDADDPAIWLHPTDPSRSLVLATHKDAGTYVFDLQANILQHLETAPYAESRHNNVDLVYDFPLGEDYVDLAVVSDRARDTLVIYQIDSLTMELTDVTSTEILETIFGHDDGETTAYGLTTWTNPADCLTYAYVTINDGNLVSQLELYDDGQGRVNATVVRVIELPVPTGDPSDSQAEGMSVDREYGILYIGIEDEVGVLKYDAKPDGGNDYVLMASFEDDILIPDVEGVAIYYGADGEGYVMVSAQGDNNFAVYTRVESLEDTNEYLGSFVIGTNDNIDQTQQTDGFEVLNVALGPSYPFGLFVTQDGSCRPQYVTQDEDEIENWMSNFKFVPWENVAESFPENLIMDTSVNPRAFTECKSTAAPTTGSPTSAPTPENGATLGCVHTMVTLCGFMITVLTLF